MLAEKFRIPNFDVFQSMITNEQFKTWLAWLELTAEENQEAMEDKTEDPEEWLNDHIR